MKKIIEDSYEKNITQRCKQEFGLSKTEVMESLNEGTEKKFLKTVYKIVRIRFIY